MSEPTVSPRKLSDFAANEAVSFVGELFPDCKDCCSARTGGDLCEPCLRAHAIVGRAMEYAMREALESVAKEGCQFCARDIPAEIIDGDWFHGHDNLGKVEGDARLWGWCEGPKSALDALSRLRSEAGSGSEPGE